MNVGIVIGVSEYLNPQANLPGTKGDAEVISEILTRTDKFQSILLINENLSSAQLKAKFTDFIASNKGNKINELFFYYSGHGEFYQNEFFYILSDFESSKRNQTTFQNTEIDNLLRSLNPELVIKVLDACQSGTQYIKESGSIDKYFQKTQANFSKCYFFHSSLNNQSSYQDNQISDFTLSFVNSVKNHQTGEIRYKDIADYISDDFQSNPGQTPFFVIQAENTEKFCSMNPNLKDYLSKLLKPKLQQVDKPLQKEQTLIDRVIEDSKEYCNEAEAIGIIEKILTDVKSFKVSETLEKLYDIKLEVLKEHEKIKNIDSVAKWAAKAESDYFAKILYKTNSYEEEVQTPVATSGNLGISGMPSISSRLSDILYGSGNYGTFGSQNINYETKKVLRTEKVPKSIEFTFKAPYIGLSLDLIPKLSNLTTYNMTLTFLLSKKTIRFFQFTTNYIELSWNNKKLNTDFEWKTTEMKLKSTEEIYQYLIERFKDLDSRIVNELTERYISKPTKELPSKKT